MPPMYGGLFLQRAAVPFALIPWLIGLSNPMDAASAASAGLRGGSRRTGNGIHYGRNV